MWWHKCGSILCQVMVCCHQAAWNNVDSSSIGFCGTYLRPISQEVLKISVHKIGLENISTSLRGQWVKPQQSNTKSYACCMRQTLCTNKSLHSLTQQKNKISCWLLMLSDKWLGFSVLCTRCTTMSSLNLMIIFNWEYTGPCYLAGIYLPTSDTGGKSSLSKRIFYWNT